MAETKSGVGNVTYYREEKGWGFINEPGGKRGEGVFFFGSDVRGIDRDKLLFLNLTERASRENESNS